jgi:hypothetical protein
MTHPTRVLDQLQAGHTPGPWYSVARLSASENHKGYLVGGGEPNQRVAEVIPVDEDGVEGGANARLIAAAPELLAACRTMLPIAEEEWGHHVATVGAGVLAEIRAAILKATGATE